MERRALHTFSLSQPDHRIDPDILLNDYIEKEVKVSVIFAQRSKASAYVLKIFDITDSVGAETNECLDFISKIKCVHALCSTWGS